MATSSATRWLATGTGVERCAPPSAWRLRAASQPLLAAQKGGGGGGGVSRAREVGRRGGAFQRVRIESTEVGRRRGALAVRRVRRRPGG